MRISSTAEATLVAILVAASAVGLIYLIATRTPPPPDPPEVARSDQVSDPYRAGEEMPRGYRQLLPRDGIVPIYEPDFVAAMDARYEPDTLVIGVTLGDEAHAYPVSELNHREMVNDWMHGTPILVTW